MFISLFQANVWMEGKAAIEQAVTYPMLCALQTRRPGLRRALARTPAPPAPAAPSKLAVYTSRTQQPGTIQGYLMRRVFVLQLVLFARLS